jgi:hypothetical protein
MKTINKLVAGVFLIMLVALSACSKNYYSGTGKGGKGCGCPATKGMSGF